MRAATISALVACAVLLVAVAAGISAIRERYTQQAGGGGGQAAAMTDDQIKTALNCMFFASLETVNVMAMAFPFALMATQMHSGDEATKQKVRDIVAIADPAALFAAAGKHFDDTAGKRLADMAKTYADFAGLVAVRKQASGCDALAAAQG